MLYKRRVSRGKKLFSRKKRSVGRKLKVSSTVKRYVKKAIHANLENKEKMNYAANQPIEATNATLTTYPLIMNTVQGTSNDTRIGNSIRIVKGQMKVSVNLLPYDATTNPSANPIWVKIWVVKDLKNTGQLSTMDNTAYLNFFRINNSGLGFQSNPLDTTLEVNNDYFRVLYSKLFKLGSASAFNAGIPVNANSYFDNSPMCKQVTINWGKWCKKQIKFNDNTGYPTNDNLYFVIQPVYADGTSTIAKRPIEMHYSNYQHFEDA